LPVNCIVRVAEGANEYLETKLQPTEFARRRDQPLAMPN
jgi:hypothetical protein